MSQFQYIDYPVNHTWREGIVEFFKFLREMKNNSNFFRPIKILRDRGFFDYYYKEHTFIEISFDLNYRCFQINKLVERE
jgi:hypothetical protein